MPAPPHGSAFDRLLNRLGGIIEEVGGGGSGKAGARGAAAGARHAAADWLLGRTMHPRHINWPRLVAATAAGLVLGEVIEALVGPRARGRRLPAGRTHVVDEEALADMEETEEAGPASARRARAEQAAEDFAAEAGMEPESAAWEGVEAEADYTEEVAVGPRSARRARAEAEARTLEETGAGTRGLLERAAADLAIAATYAAIVYPRLPGPRWFRAAVFGAADVLVSSGGGIATTLADLSPRIRTPLAQLLPDEERRVERALALALALALIYRDEHEEEEDDEH